MVKQKTINNFFENISNDMVEEIFNMSDDEIRTHVDNYYDDTTQKVATMRKNINSLINDCHKERQKKWQEEAQEKAENLSSNISNMPIKWAKLTLVEIKDKIHEFLDINDNNFAVEYRDFEQLDKESLLDILTNLSTLSDIKIKKDQD